MENTRTQTSEDTKRRIVLDLYRKHIGKRLNNLRSKEQVRDIGSWRKDEYWIACDNLKYNFNKLFDGHKKAYFLILEMSKNRQGQSNDFNRFY